MAWDPNQGQPNDPNSAYGTPSNPYGAPPPQDPSGTPQGPYGAPQNPPYAPPLVNPYAGPPPHPYAQQGPGYSPPQSAPLPLGEAIKGLPQQYIKVTTRPGVMTFAEEMGKASWDIVWIQLIGLAIISAILTYLATLISPTFNSTSTSSINPAAIRSLIGMGIFYGLARAIGGQGRFVTQSYAYLLFGVPIGIVTSIVNLIPYLGVVIVSAISIYSIVLNIFSIMAVHRLSGGKATAVVLIPIGVALLLVCALVVLFVTLIVAALQHQ
jgi:hypothetical protein